LNDPNIILIERVYDNILIILAKIKAIYDFLSIIFSPIMWYNNYFMMREIIGKINLK